MNEHGKNRQARRRSGSWLIALALPLLLWPLAVSRNGPGEPLPANAPAEVFSGYRARAELEVLLDGVGPHPVGTRAAGVVRERLLARLVDLGLEPEVQDTWVVTDRGWSTRVRNVWASIPAAPAPAAGDAESILLLCHYDSVGASPGAGDDGSGVACALEITRALLASATAREREVFLLFDEAEEDGLFGAQAFLDEHPAAARVALVVNLEARGTEGASLMFETSRDNAGLMELYGAVVPRPMANSLSGEAYRRMPNGTDLSLFLDRGIAGYNFAFIGGGSRYHTDRDDLAHLSTASLQHQGESALALLRGLLRLQDLAPVTRAADADRYPLVYTSLLGSMLLSWPEPLSPLLALLALVPVLLVLRRGRRQGVFRWRQLLLAAPVGLALVLMPVAVDYGLYRGVLTLTGLSVLSSAHADLGAGLPRLLFLSAGLLPLLAFGPFLARLARPLALWGVLGLGLGLAALLSGLFLPSVSFVPLLPAFVLALAGVFMRARGGGDAVGNGQPADAPTIGAVGVLPVVVAVCLLWIPLCLVLESAFGFAGGFVWSVPAGMGALVLAPLLTAADRRSLTVARLATILITGLAFLALVRLPHFSADDPAPLNLTCFHDGSGETGARWLLKDYGLWPDEPLARAGGFDPAPEDLWLPGGRWPWLAGGPAPWSPGGPRLEILSEAPSPAAVAGEDAGRLLRLRLTPGTGGDVTTLTLAMEGGVPLRSLTVEGRGVPVNGPARIRRNGGLQVYGIRGSGDGSVELELEFGGTEPVGISILEQTLGLPPCGEALLGARAPHRAPLQAGDRSIMAVHVTI